MTYICYLCRDTCEILHKVCSCESAYLCGECLGLTEENINDPANQHENRLKCHICRNFLSLYFLPNIRYYQKIFKFYFIKFFFMFGDIAHIIVIYQMSETKYPSYFYTSRNHFAIQNLLQIFLCKNSTKMLFGYIYNVNNNNTPDIDFYHTLDGLYLALVYTLFGLCFLKSHIQVIDLYSILITGVCYLFPYLLVSIMAILDSLGNTVQYIRRQNQNAKIKIVSHYYNPQLLITEHV